MLHGCDEELKCLVLVPYRVKEKMYVGISEVTTGMLGCSHLKYLALCGIMTQCLENLKTFRPSYTGSLRMTIGTGEHVVKKKKRSASSGFMDAMLLIFSGFCQRTDFYGLSNNCGGAYYNTKHVMQNLHNCELESWMLHLIMKDFENFGVCIYL